MFLVAKFAALSHCVPAHCHNESPSPGFTVGLDFFDRLALSDVAGAPGHTAG
jgi:hypothetical protein